MFFFVRKLTLAGHNHFLLSVQVIFVALGVAAATLQGGRGFKDVPQRSSTGLTARGEVVQSGDELVALVTYVGRSVTKRCGLHDDLLVPFDFTFIGVQDLKGKKKKERRQSLLLTRQWC